MARPIKYKILHISDLHIGTKSGKDMGTLPLDIITGSLRSHLPIEFVAVTGDLFFQGKEADPLDDNTINKVIDFLTVIKTLLDIQQEKQFLFVPGNQDVYCVTGLNGIEQERFKFYIKAINTFMSGGSDKTASLIQWFNGATGADSLNTAIYLPSPLEHLNVEFFLLNSVCNYLKPRDRPVNSDADIRISQSEIEYFKRFEIAENNREPRVIPKMRIGLVHNSPLDLHRYSRDTIRNSGELRELLSKCHVSLLLHGDRHDSQQAAAPTALNSWPLYVTGAGQINPETPGADTAHFQVIEITTWETLFSAEIEIYSYHIKGSYSELETQECHHLCIPLKTIADSEASIHKFELASSFSDVYRHRIGKEILLKARASSFGRLHDFSRSVLNKQTAYFEPDLMYLLFYENMFKWREKGGIFRAVHDHNWRVWCDDPANIEVLEDHSKAAEDEDVDIQRVIILQDKDVDKIRDEFESHNNVRNESAALLSLCMNLATKWVDNNPGHGCFKTFLAKYKKLQEFYRFAEKLIGGRHNPLREIMVGNIALFAEAEKVEQAADNNSIAFYFTKINNGRLRACITVDPVKVKGIKKLILNLWSKPEYFIDCSQINTLEKVRSVVDEKHMGM